MAVVCERFLENFRAVKVWCVQYPTKKDYTCWYASFRDKENPYIMHFDIRQKSIKVYFRHPKYLFPHDQKRLKWDLNWQYIIFRDDNEVKYVRRMVAQYLENIKTDFLEERVKGRIHKKCQEST
jgi:hypothetical protein